MNSLPHFISLDKAFIIPPLVLAKENIIPEELNSLFQCDDSKKSTKIDFRQQFLASHKKNN